MGLGWVGLGFWLLVLRYRSRISELTGRVEVLSERGEELEETVEMEKGAAGICRTIKNVRRRWY